MTTAVSRDGKHSACRGPIGGPACDNRDMRAPVSLRLVAIVAVATLAGACQLTGEPAMDPAMAGMGCEQAQAFSFSGETTLAALGLDDDFGGGRDAQRPGMIWVTADPVNMNGPGPLPAGVPAAMDRMVCVQWPDGSGMAGPVPPDWQPPNVLNTAAPGTGGEIPLTLIGLVVAAIAIVGVSFFAFRERRPA